MSAPVQEVEMAERNPRPGGVEIEQSRRERMARAHDRDVDGNEAIEWASEEWHLRIARRHAQSGTALILHPTVRDDYGVLTRNRLYELRGMAEHFMEGWAASISANVRYISIGVGDRNELIPVSGRGPSYTDVRDFLLGFDPPYEYACQVALYLTRYDRDGWIEPRRWRWFTPVL